MPSLMLSKVADSSTPDSCAQSPGYQQAMTSQNQQGQQRHDMSIGFSVLDVFPSESKARQQWFQRHGQLLNGSSCCLLSVCFGIEVYAKLVGQRNQAIDHGGTHKIHHDHRKDGVCQVVHRRTHQFQTFHPWCNWDQESPTSVRKMSAPCKQQVLDTTKFKEHPSRLVQFSYGPLMTAL